jgi:hypothetical protein
MGTGIYHDSLAQWGFPGRNRRSIPSVSTRCRYVVGARPGGSLRLRFQESPLGLPHPRLLEHSAASALSTSIVAGKPGDCLTTRFASSLAVRAVTAARRYRSTLIAINRRKTAEEGRNYNLRRHRNLVSRPDLPGIESSTTCIHPCGGTPPFPPRAASLLLRRVSKAGVIHVRMRRECSTACNSFRSCDQKNLISSVDREIE